MGVYGSSYAGASIVYGALDEVGLWDVALDSGEIAQLFADGACHRSSL